jgi:hypothetical protein
MADNHIFEYTTQVKYPSSAIPVVFFLSNINLLKVQSQPGNYEMNVREIFFEFI